MCEACDDNAKAAFLCLQCCEVLCLVCCDAHGRVRITKNHTIIPYNTGAMQDTKEQFCRKHLTERLRFYCERCDRLTCRTCQQENHKHHPYCLISDAANKLRQQLAAKVNVISERVSSLETAAAAVDQKLKTLLESEERTRAQINAFILSFGETVNILEKSLHASVCAAALDERRNVKHLYDDVYSLLMRLNMCKETVECAVQSKIKAALLVARAAFVAQLDDLLGTQPKILKSRIFDICLSHDPRLLDHLKELVGIRIFEPTLEPSSDTNQTS